MTLGFIEKQLINEIHSHMSVSLTDTLIIQKKYNQSSKETTQQLVDTIYGKASEIMSRHRSLFQTEQERQIALQELQPTIHALIIEQIPI